MNSLKKIIFFLFLSGVVYGQSGESPSLAQQYFDEAIALRREAKFDAAIKKSMAAEQLFKEKEQWDKLIQTRNLQAWCTLSIGEFEEMKEIIEETQIIAKQKKLKNSLAVAEMHRCAGAQAIKVLGYDQAISLCKKGISVVESIDPDSKELGNHYNSLAIAYFFKSDWKKALDTYQLSLEIKRRHYPENSIEVAKAYNNIGIVYREMGQLDKAIDYYNKSLVIKRKILGPKHRSIAMTYNNISSIYKDMEDYQSSVDILEKALEIELETFGKENHYVLEKYGALSGSYTALKDYEKAHYYNNKLLALRESAPNKRSIIYGRSLKQAGTIYGKEKKFDLSFDYYLQAINTLLLNVKLKNKYDRPAETDLVPNRDLIYVLLERGKAFMAYYEVEQRQEWLENALLDFELASKTVDVLRNSFDEELSQIVLQQDALMVSESGIEVCHKLWKATSGDQYLEKAFSFSEKNKSIVLRSAIQAEEAIQYAGLPTTIIQKEKKLKKEVYQASKKVYRSANDDSNDEFSSDSLVAWKRNEFETKNTYQAFIAQLEKEYPDYYQLKYNSSFVSLADIQQKLTDDKTQFIEYFTGEENSYVFSVSKQKKSIHLIRNPEKVSKLLAEFVPMIKDKDLAGNQGNSKATFQEFSDLSAALFDLLLKPILAQQTGSIVLIPDGQLYSIPFDLLLTERVDNNSPVDYTALPYLLKKAATRYYNSASFYHHNESSTSNKKSTLIAFAPSYEGQENSLLASRDGFSSLAFAKKEVDNICALTGGKAMTGNAASKEEFLASAKDHKLLHLAMHAFTDDENPLHSGLIFTQRKKAEKEGILYAHELYDMKLNADLVVLSACNTGNGKLAKGEGTMSLARAFRHAGCPNILMSLWQADDETTEQVMNGFYKNLKEGKPKDKALQAAKLNYLEQSSRKAFPYYWGTFVLLGNEDAVDFSAPFGYFHWMMGGFVILLLAIYLLKRKI